MGNHQQHQEIQRKINELQVIRKNSHYWIMKGPDATEYIKLLYTFSFEDKQHQESGISKSNSIFNKKYLEFRYVCQNQQNKMSLLPKIIAFGEEPQSHGLISCSGSQLGFVIFQHPTKTLKQQIQNRITSGQFFKQAQLLSLMNSVVHGLSQYYQHIKSWNEQILQRKQLIINQENIYVTLNGEFLISDIISNFNQIQNVSKQQVTLKRTSRANSLTNLHAKTSGKKMKFNFFEINLNNLASIIQGIVFKFQCFSQPYKNSFQQSQSLSTALQSHRGIGKNASYLSNQFEKILKLLRQKFDGQDLIIQEISKLINAVHLPLPIQRTEDTAKSIELKNIQNKGNVTSSLTHQLKLNQMSSQKFQPRMPLSELQSQNTFSQTFGKIQRSTYDIQSRRSTNHFSEINYNKSTQKRTVNKSSTKLRLSLKKDFEAQKQFESRQISIEKHKVMKRKTSHPKFLCSKIGENQTVGKQNRPISIKINPIISDQKIKSGQISNPKAFAQKILNTKLVDPQINRFGIGNQQKKKVFLKKPTNHNNQILKAKQINQNEQKNSNSESMIHTNPMSRKKTIGLNKFLNSQNKQGILKTAQKGTNEPIDLDFIQNLSSIISNQNNNTLSSYGIPINDQFKTQTSEIQDQGCIGFNQFSETQPIKNGINLVLSNENIIRNSKKTIHTLSPPCVKLSSYPSLELVESIIQRPEDKIPEFLKQFKLPEKNLLALNNIILKQKDMIVQESFQQSEFNSIRHSIPNILGLEEDIHDLKKKRSSKVILIPAKQDFDHDIFRDVTIENCHEINPSKRKNQITKSLIQEEQGDSVQRQLKFIEISLIDNVN